MRKVQSKCVYQYHNMWSQAIEEENCNVVSDGRLGDLEAVPHSTLPHFEYKVRRLTDERVGGLERIKYIEKS
jgi:hypothetical protein